MKSFLNISKYIILLILCMLCISCNDESECKEIEFRVDGNVLEWRYTDGEWKPVYDLSEINKEDIKNEAKDLILEVIDGKLVYSYGDETLKQELIDLSTLKGEDGKQVEFYVVDNKLVYSYENTENQENTVVFDFDSLMSYDKKLELKVEDLFLMCRYKDDTNWTKLYDFNELAMSLVNIELKIIDNKLVYCYGNELVELIDLDTLKGENGKQLELEVNGNKLMYGYEGGEKSLLIDFVNLFNNNKVDFVFEDLTLKWRYQFEDEWRILFNFTDILNLKNNIKFNVVDNKLTYKIGEKEEVLFDLNELKGVDGKEVEFEVVDNKLMFGYEGEEKSLLFDFNNIVLNNLPKAEYIVEDFVLKYKFTTDTEWIELINIKEIFDDMNDNLSDLVVLEKVQTAFNKVIEDSSKAVLGIVNYGGSGTKLVRSSLGTGFVYKAYGMLSENTITLDFTNPKIISYKYYLITNRHVVEDSKALKVYVYEDNEEYDAKLIKYDTKDDLAVVEFVYDKYIEPLKLGDSSTVKSGDFVIAIGNPEGLQYSSSATMGIVSYPDRLVSVDTNNDDTNDWYLNCVQHDCAINPGNSGGPLLNIYGEVVGVNTLKFASEEIDNMGFSITIDTVKQTISYLEKGELPPRIVLGITISAIRDVLSMSQSSWKYNYLLPSSVKEGLYVSAVSNGSIGAKVLKQDDIIIEFNGAVMKTQEDLRRQLNKLTPNSGQIVKVKVFRNGFKVDLELKIE